VLPPIPDEPDVWASRIRYWNASKRPSSATWGCGLEGMLGCGEGFDFAEDVRCAQVLMSQ